MRNFYFHVGYVDKQGVRRFRSTSFSANNLLQAHEAGRKLVALLAVDPEIESIDYYYLESTRDI